MKLKLALGTVQFGLAYGINNKIGKVEPEQAFVILGEAEKHGIDTLDTAYSYGDSEEVIGEYLKDNRTNFRVISKLPACEADKVEYYFDASLRRLRTDRIYGYLFHDFGSYKEDTKKLGVLDGLRREGRVRKIGFSLYYPGELEYLLKNKVRFDLLQVPYSILDQRFGGFLRELSKRDIEVHIRSVFLQGFFFKSLDELKGDFLRVKDKLAALRYLSGKTGIPLSALCLNFATANEFIDRVIVGVDSLGQFRENLEALSYMRKTAPIYKSLLDLRMDDENIILPMNWKDAK